VGGGGGGGGGGEVRLAVQNVFSAEEIYENFINFKFNFISDLHKTLTVLYHR